MKKLSFLSFLSLSAVSAMGQAGTLDASFGTAGKYTPPAFYQSANCVLQSDGKIIATGIDSTGGINRFYTARYLPAGWRARSYLWYQWCRPYDSVGYRNLYNHLGCAVR